MSFCTRCGTQLGENLLYCPNCGQLLLSPPGPPGNVGVPRQFFPEDARALAKIKLFAILSLINAIVGYVGTFYFLPKELAGFAPSSSSTAGSATFLQFLFSYLLYFSVIAAILTAISLFFLSSGFRLLAKIADEFGTPSKLTLVALVSVPALFITLVALLSYMIPLMAQIPPTAPSPAPVFSFFGISLVLLIAGIAGLIGEIGGVLLGLWRAGTRYDDSLFKAGAICFIIPFLSIISPILILLSIRQIRASHLGSIH